MKNTRFFMTIARIIIIVLLTACIFCMFIVSPYNEWDTSLKIVDYDVVDVQKVALLFLSIINIAITMFSRKAHKDFVIIHVVFAAICILRFSWLMTL